MQNQARTQRPSATVDFVEMRVKVANFFGGLRADKDVHDLPTWTLCDLYDLLPDDAR